MKTKQILFLLLSGSLLLNASCIKENKEEKVNTKSDFDTLAVPHSMKGYELYSWPEGNKWYFSLLAGTNRTKTYTEVTSDTSTEVHLITVTGIDALKLVLDRFPENEDITWIGKDWLQSTWGGNYGNLQLPQQNYIDEIIKFCSQKKLNLQVTG